MGNRLTSYIPLFVSADLVRYIYRVGSDLSINVETPPPRRVIYQGGTLEQGGVQNYKKNLFAFSNIRSNSFRAPRGEGFAAPSMSDSHDPLADAILQGE